MFPYLLTFMYIVSICVLSSGEAQRCYRLEVLSQIKQEKEQLRSYIKSLTAEANYFDFVNVKQDVSSKSMEVFSEKNNNKTYSKESSSSPKRNRSLQVDISRPPNNSRINLCALLLEAEASQQEPFSWFSIISRLLVSKYLTKEALKDYTPNDVNKLLLTIIDNKQKILELATQKPSADVLFSISLEDEKISQLLHYLLAGGEDFPSLLCFLDYVPKKSVNFCKLNFLFLDSYILEALFNKPSVVKSLQDIQQKILLEILEREKEFQQVPSQQLLKTRSDFKAEIKEQVSQILIHNGFGPLVEKNIFDFSLGKIGNYFLIKGSQEYSITRVKYLSSKDRQKERIN